MFEICVEEKFDAAHCLRGYPGNCEKLHGHTYRVQAKLRVSDLDRFGMAIDFREVRSALKSMLEQFDHSYLNDLPEFADKNPSAENIAKAIYDALKNRFGAAVYMVTVWETDTSSASYWEEQR